MPDSQPRSLGSRWARWFGLTVVATAFMLAYAGYTGWLAIPPRFNPWAPLDVMARPDFLTRYQLMRTKNNPQRCLDALQQTGMQYDVLPDRVTGSGCGFDNAVRLRSAAIRFGAPLSLSCPMALSFFMWERHALQSAALKAFGQQVAAIDHFGSYACRNINRGQSASQGTTEGTMAGGTRSQHATADALDISAFILADGRRIALTQWPATPDRRGEAAWLRTVQAGACRYFDGVLGPDYNAAHRDHFHLETGGYTMCR